MKKTRRCVLTGWHQRAFFNSYYEKLYEGWKEKVHPYKNLFGRWKCVLEK